MCLDLRRSVTANTSAFLRAELPIYSHTERRFPMTIAENLAEVQANIARAAEKAGRDPKDILPIGATKM